MDDWNGEKTLTTTKFLEEEEEDNEKIRQQIQGSTKGEDRDHQKQREIIKGESFENLNSKL